MTTPAETSQTPRFLILDTSVLLPLIATDLLKPILQGVYDVFRVASTVHPAVKGEAEFHLSRNRKFLGRQEQLNKAFRKGTVSVLERSFLERWHSRAAADALLDQIDQEGERLNAWVDRGEAYSHAASFVLEVPIVTGDQRAVRVLLDAGEPVPRPVLRFWDLVVLGFQCGWLDANACDKVRQRLRDIGERLPPWLQHRSFRDGLCEFYPRLVSASHPVVGSPQPTEALDQDPRLVLSPFQSAE